MIGHQGKSMTLHWGGCYTPSFHLTTPSYLGLGPLGSLFELTLAMALDLAVYVASGTIGREGQHQVWCARRGCPRTPSKTTDANLDFAPLLLTDFSH